MRIAIGADERNDLTDMVVEDVRRRGHDVDVVAPERWPEVARKVAESVSTGAADQGILFCWTGTGTTMAANKVPGVRAALVWEPWIAEGARKWNDANVLVMSFKRTSPEVAQDILDTWFSVDLPDPDEAENIALLEESPSGGTAFGPETRLVTVTASDGLALPGALWMPATRGRVGPVDGLVMIHGSTGSLASGLQVHLARYGAAAGLPSLSFSNRGHDVVWAADDRYYGHACENVAESVADVEGALDLLTRAGCERIALIGHSLGGVKSVYYGVHGRHPAVAAIVAVSPPRFSASFFPKTQRAAKYERVKQRVDEAYARDPDGLIEVDFPFRSTLMTPRTWRQKYDSEEFNVVHLAPQVRHPLLYVAGSLETGDAHIQLADDLRQLPAGPSPRGVEVIEGAEHFYVDRRQQLRDTIFSWLQSLM